MNEGSNHPETSTLSEAAKMKALETEMSYADHAAYVDKMNATIKAGHGVSDRVCGECTACCTVMGVAELNKPIDQRCAHICKGGGCAIYDRRPRMCRSWSCCWLLGRIEGDERWRPDKLGLLFNRERLAGKPITVAYEVWLGAAKESANAFLLRKMSQDIPIVLREYPNRSCNVLTPDPEKWQLITRLIQIHWCPTEYIQILVTNFPSMQ